MAAGTYNIEFARNGDWNRQFLVVNDQDEPYDLTGATFDMDIRYLQGSDGPPLIDLPIECDAPESGVFELTLNGDDFQELGDRTRNTRFVYDIVATQDGRRLPLVSGEVLLTPGVSNNEA